jgi:hypothetical protein
MDNCSQEEKARGRRRSGYIIPSCDKKDIGIHRKKY